jgi:hypothetical protein
MPKPKPFAYRNKVMRDVIRVLTPTAIATNLSPQRLVGFAKAVADVAAIAANEPIMDIPATALTPSAPAAKG